MDDAYWFARGDERVYSAIEKIAWRAYKKGKKDNKELSDKNKEVTHKKSMICVSFIYDDFPDEYLFAESGATIDAEKICKALDDSGLGCIPPDDIDWDYLDMDYIYTIKKD